MLTVKFEEKGISVSDFAAKDFVRNYFEECQEEIFSLEAIQTFSISTYRLLQEICLYCLENLDGEVNKYIKFYFGENPMRFQEHKGLDILSENRKFFTSTEQALDDIREKALVKEAQERAMKMKKEEEKTRRRLEQLRRAKAASYSRGTEEVFGRKKLEKDLIKVLEKNNSEILIKNEDNLKDDWLKTNYSKWFCDDDKWI